MDASVARCVAEFPAFMEDPSSVPHSLVPLTLAVVIVRERVYAGDSAPNAEDHLSGIATAIAALIPIYEYGHKPEYAPRILSSADLAGGLFRDNGKELRFVDGRSAKISLAVRAADVERVVGLLIQARK
jgi:hypothetical protein